MRAAVVEWSKVLQVIWVSLVAGVGITTLFSLAILGTTRATESRRQGSSAAAGAYAVLAAAGFLGVAGAVVFGILIILDK